MYMQCSPIPLAIIHSCAGIGFDAERAVHELFAADRLHHEWFTRTARLDAFIARLKAGAEIRGLIEAFAAGKAGAP